MNEIKKCPFCGGNAHVHIYVDRKTVYAVTECSYCGIEIKTGRWLDGDDFFNAMTGALKTVLEIWNKRAEEPQEKKETRFERLLKEEQRADKLVCCLAYRDKYKGKDCATEICGECEFCDCENAINYLLAPCEEKDGFVAVSDLISKTQSSANEILEALRANAKKHE